LVIIREKSADGTKDYANVQGILPANKGVTVQIPADFVRAKDKPAKTQNAAPQQQMGQQQQQSQGEDLSF